MLIDPNGDSLNVSNLDKGQQDILIADLNSQTGLSIFVNKIGNLDYKKEGNEAVVNGGGSETARTMMLSAMDNETKVTVTAIESGVSHNNNLDNTISINFTQTQDLIDKTVGVDKSTMGYGMTLMHEVSHNKSVGNGLHDNFTENNPRGDNVDFMNKIRSELNSQGKNYGQRKFYNPVFYISESTLKTEMRLPFDNDGSAIDKYVILKK
jgi:hypothetical protein